MKPKKGETNNEMDEPMRNPLQLVKDLVLLIAEARTPDFTVKGRIEGPHCPIIRGRPAHKCSADKVECARANEFCCLAQRLWLNSIPVCLDILLFPDCIHGQEEAVVTEGAVAKLSQENVLLIERWTIDWTKRRQDDCLSSSMLIQAVRSYLHFSQISSWLYSTGGRLPGRLTYRMYAPGEVTSLDFPHPPDIHSFPVCLVSFHPIRVKVSSLQRQASVPILVCHQKPTVGDNIRETLYRDKSQGKRSKGAEAKTKEQLQEFVSGTCFMGSPWSCDKLQTTDPVTMGYSTSATTVKRGTKSVKSLHSLNTPSPLVYEEQIDDMCGTSYAVRNPFMFTKTGNMFSHFEETDDIQTMSGADIRMGKATSLARVMISDGGDDVETTADIIARMFSAKDLSRGNEIMNASFNALGVGASDLQMQRFKSSHLKMEQGLFNQGLIQGINSRKGYASMSDKNREWDISGQKRGHARAVNKVGEVHLHGKQMRTGFRQNTHERKLDKYFENKGEYINLQTDDDALILTNGGEEVDCCKSAQCLHEHPRMTTELEMLGDVQVAGIRNLSQNVLANNGIVDSDKKLSFPVSSKQMFYDGLSLDQTDRSACYSKVGIHSKLQTRKLGNSSQKGADEDEEKAIEILSDKLSMVMTPNKGTSSSSKLSAELQGTSSTVLKSLLQNEDAEADGLFDGREKLTAWPIQKYLDQNVEFSQLTVDVSKLADTFEDSDDTPVASPNHTPQSRSVPETLMKSVTEKSIKQNLYWLQKDLSNPGHVETSLELVDASVKNSDHELSENKENGYGNEDPLGEVGSSYSQTSDQSSSRRMFEKNLLPLVSYDANSDSFRKVDDFLSCNVLHSPKVLFSCDLPNTKLTSSKKCIDFSDTFEAEFFKSKMNDLVDPEAIGKYMSKLALLSGASTNGKDDQGDDVLVGKAQYFDDLIRPDATSNVYLSSNTECSLKQRREIQDVQTRNSTDLQSACNYTLIMPDNYRTCDSEGQSDKTVLGDASVTRQELSGDTECLVSRDGFPQTRRQLNYFDLKNTQPALNRKTIKQESVIETPAALALSPLCNNTFHKDFVQKEEEYQDRNLSEITGLKGTVITYPSDTIALQTSPPLSSSCSSSSSSSSISSVQMRSVPPPSPTVLSPTNAHKTLHSEKESEDDNSMVDNQESLCTCLSSLTSDKPSDGHIDGSPSRAATRATVNTGKLQSDFKSNLKPSCNAESFTFPHVCASVSIPLASATSTPLSSLSLNSTSSISVHSLPSSVYLTPQVQHDASHTNLCHTEDSSTPSLFKDTIPQPSPQDNADFDSGSGFYFKPESTSPNDVRHIMSDLLANQNIDIHYLCSQRISNTNSVQCVPNLFHEQPYVRHLCEVQVASRKCVDQQKYVTYSKNHGIENTSCQLVSDCDTSLDTVAAKHTNIDQSCQKNNLPDITKSTHTPLHSSQLLNRDDVPADDNSCSTVITTRISTHNKTAELISVSLETVAEGSTYSSNNIDSSKIKFKDSTIPMPNGDIESLHNESGSSDLLNNIYSRSNDAYATTGVNPLTTGIISDDSSLSQEQSETFLKEKDTLLRDLGFEIRSQNGEEFHDVFQPSFVEHSGSSYTSNCYQKPTGIEQCSEACLERDPGVTDQNENVHLQNPSLRVIQTGQDSKNGFEVEANDTKENDISDSNWDSDVVFYLSEPEARLKADHPVSALSNSLKEVTSSETYKAIRPSSLSAEVNLEIKLRSNPGIKDKTDLEFSTHSRSPPFLSDPPGWNSVPPHRTVSTPSGMDRETRIKEERASANISVIQQQNCDNVSQTGLRKMAAKSASMIFNNRTGLPTQSSPAPLKRKSGGKFEYDVSLLNTRAIKNAFSCSKLASGGDNNNGDNEEKKNQTLSTSAPASTNCLLGNFEESILNGRIDPVGTVDGFSAEIGASGSFCPKHIHLPVPAFFFALSDDNAPSPYLGYINLESIGKKGYHIPKKGTVQVTLFNPNKMVVKMFVVVYDLSDMPASSQTFIRQRTVYSPVDKNHPAPSYLRYLIHLRCASSHSGKIYLHTDIRLIFARQKLDIDAKTIPYELKSYTEGPQNPKYSPKK